MESKVGSEYSASAVLDQVAHQANANQLALPPLHDEIDADALNVLFTGSHTTTIQLTFTHIGPVEFNGNFWWAFDLAANLS